MISEKYRRIYNARTECRKKTKAADTRNVTAASSRRFVEAREQYCLRKTGLMLLGTIRKIRAKIDASAYNPRSEEVTKIPSMRKSIYRITSNASSIKRNRQRSSYLWHYRRSPQHTGDDATADNILNKVGICLNFCSWCLDFLWCSFFLRKIVNWWTNWCSLWLTSAFLRVILWVILIRRNNMPRVTQKGQVTIPRQIHTPK